jgi:hypothetical protein
MLCKVNYQREWFHPREQAFAIQREGHAELLLQGL